MAHDQSCRRAAYDFPKAGALVKSARAEEHEVVMAALRLIDRICLEHPDALLTCIVDSAGKQLVLVPLASMDLGNVGAHDRPDRYVVNGLQTRERSSLR